MLDALFDLERALRLDKRKGQLTLEEQNVLNSWRTRAARNAVVATGGGCIFTWLAMPRLGYLLPANLTLPTPGLRFLFRANISLFAGFFCGLRQANKCVNSAVEHILALEGSRMQEALASIMLNKYEDDPWVVSNVSKYFYSEKVYDDETDSSPRNRWRARSYFGDTAAVSENKIQNKDAIAIPQPKQVHANVSNDAPAVEEESPFDMIFFGIPQTVKTSDPPPPATPTWRQRRRQRRASTRF